MNEILLAREERSHHINELMNDFPNKTIIIIKKNVVGDNKNPLFMKFLCAFYSKHIYDVFQDKIVFNGHSFSKDGDYCFFVVDELGTLVKVRTIEIEEASSLGRLIDIDVYNKKTITRQDLSCEMRKCLICENYAHICARNQTHSKEELFQKTKEIITNYLTDYLTTTTMKAIFSELELYPKFGLVSHKDSGCHEDMDYETFVSSAFAIKPFITQYIEMGFQDYFEPKELQKIGQKAEKKMFLATNGVNTHKGLIFLLGVFLPALAKSIFYNNTVDELISEIARISNEIIGDYYNKVSQKTEHSNSDQIFLKTGIKGVREEASNGLQKIFDIPTYYDLQLEDRYHQYLIHLMSVLDDTTIIHKNDLSTLQKVQQDMKDILNSGGYVPNKEKIHLLSDEYKKQSISPGGCADMLVIKLIYEDVKHLFRFTKYEI